MNPLPVRRLAPVLLALGLAACSDKPATVTPSDSTSAERVDALEREIRAMRDDQSALRGTTVLSSEGLALATRMKDLQNRINELETKNAALAAALPATGTPSAAGTASTGSGPTFPSSVGVPIPTDLTQPIPTETIAAFRRISDEVDKIKTAEQQAKRLKDDLTRAGVTLTADQEAALAKVQSSYSEKIRELYRNGGGATDADRTALVAQRDAIRAQFETEIRQVVPASEADKIVETMSRDRKSVV